MKRNILNNINIIIPLSLILFIGLYMVYSSSSIWANYLYLDSTYYIKRQVLFTIIGIILMYTFSRINISLIRKYINIIYMLGILMLIVVLIPGIGVEVNGSRSWYKIGIFLFQPAEFFKIIIVLFMADKLSKNYLQTKSFYKTICILLIPAIIGFGLIMLQPDLGTGLVMISSIIMMCIVCKNKFKNYLIIAIFACVCLGIIIATSAYRSERIIAFINPYSDPLGSGFQSIQSLYAIGPGGIIGQGVNSSFQKHFFLPEPQTDFIFSIFAEDYGLVGCVILIFLYGFLITKMFDKAILAKSEFTCLLRCGITSLIIIQVCINLCVVVGLIPVTGITLPFMSYGGSSITMLLSSVGLLLNEREDESESIIIRQW